MGLGFIFKVQELNYNYLFFYLCKYNFFSRISCLDAHSLGGENSKSIIAQVMGNVSIGGEWHAYNQVLILIYEDGNYRAQSDNYRLIE